MFYKKIAVSALALAISGTAFAADFKVGDDYILTGAVASTAQKVQVTEYFGYWCPHCNNFEPLLEQWLEEKADSIEFSRVPVAFSTRSQNQVLAQKAYYVGKQVKLQKSVDSTMFDFYHKYGRLASSFKDIDKIQADPAACTAEVNGLVDRAQKQSAQSNKPFDVASVTAYLNENVCNTDARGWALLKLSKESRGSISNEETLQGVMAIAGVDTENFSKRLESFSMTSAMAAGNKKAEILGIDSVPTLVINDKYRVTSAKGFQHMLDVVEFLIEKEEAEVKK
jgi:predicted DsbA family dithiol-disulfide isomerase